MSIPENHSPPSPSELAGFTREGEALLGFIEATQGFERRIAVGAHRGELTLEALIFRWVVAVERELAKVKP